MILTPEQEEAGKVIDQFLSSPTDTDMILTGCAGSGKTTSLKYILEKHADHYDICVATVSHDAKNVLLDALEGLDVDGYTFASLVGMKPVKNGRKKKFVRDPYSKSRIQEYSLLIFDETSMTSQAMQDIINELRPANMKVIYVGDKNQLPPIDENPEMAGVDSPTFSLPICAELGEPIRYDEVVGDAVKIYQKAISWINQGKNFSFKLIEDFHYSKENEKTVANYTHDKMGWIKKALVDFRNDPTGTRIIPYRVKTVEALNTFCRKYLYPNQPEYVNGEYLILNEPYLEGTGREQSTVAVNGAMLEILDLGESMNYEIGYVENGIIRNAVIRYYYAKVMDLSKVGGGEKKVRLVSLSDKQKFANVLNLMAEACKQRTMNWGRDFYPIKEFFSEAEFCYATTAYKAQGKSINNVYVHAQDVFDVRPITNKQKCQALYTACTRVKHNLQVLY